MPTSDVKLRTTDGSPEHVQEIFASLSRRSFNCHSIMLPSPSDCILGNLIQCSQDALLGAAARFDCQSLHGPSLILGSRPKIRSLSFFDRLLQRADLKWVCVVTVLEASSACKQRSPDPSTLFATISFLFPFPPGLRFVLFLQHLATSTERVNVAVTLRTCILELLG
jgi:hypothetical protein